MSMMRSKTHFQVIEKFQRLTIEFIFATAPTQEYPSLMTTSEFVMALPKGLPCEGAGEHSKRMKLSKHEYNANVSDMGGVLRCNLRQVCEVYYTGSFQINVTGLCNVMLSTDQTHIVTSLSNFRHGLAGVTGATSRDLSPSNQHIPNICMHIAYLAIAHLSFAEKCQHSQCIMASAEQRKQCACQVPLGAQSASHSKYALATCTQAIVQII